MSAALEFARVSRWYGQVLGVSDISFRIESGVVGLLGINGAGKSTMMKLASGLMRPSIGEVTVFGEAPTASLPIRKRIGFCPDVDKFYEHMSGVAWVTHMAKLAGVANARQRAREVLADLGMEERMKRKIGGYSKGMRQRTKLARALVTGAELVLLDEPLNGLDPVGRHEMIALIHRLGSEGKSVLVSSHVLHEVQDMTDRLLLIHQGRLLAEGKVGDIRDQLRDRALQVQICARDVRALAQRLVGESFVEGIDIEGDRLVARVRESSRFLDAVAEIGLEESIGIDSVQSLDADLEAVFGYLVRK